MRVYLTFLILSLGTVLAQTDPKPPLSVTYEEKTGKPAFWDENLNVQYARQTPKHSNVDLVSLDIYSPKQLSDGERLPAIVVVHGGSWKGGDKANLTVVYNKVTYFVSQDFIVISINYGLTPDISYPQQPQDVADAVAYIEKHAKELHIDASEIFLMGHSAGAQLAELVATDGKFLRNAGANTHAIRGVVVLDGISNLVTKIQQDIRDENENNNRDITAAFGHTREQLEAGSPVYQVKSLIMDFTPPMMLYFRGNAERARDDAGMIATLKKNKIPTGGVYVGPYSHAAMNTQVGVDDILTPSILAFLRGADPASLSAVHH